MGYNLFETPDHLHRGLHLFASLQLQKLLDWILEKRPWEKSEIKPWEKAYFSNSNNSWFLSDLLENLTGKTKKSNLLARKEAQEFFKKYPELREKKSYSAYFRNHDYTEDEKKIFEKFDEEYNEYEVHGEIEDWPHLVRKIESVRMAIYSKSLAQICDEISSFDEAISEIIESPAVILNILSILHDLFYYGLRDDAHLLNNDIDEAYEVTKLCNGLFRTLAKKNIDAIRLIKPVEFENLVAEMFSQLGLQEVETTPLVNDGGVDIVAAHVQENKKLKYIVQCKRNAEKNKVNVKVVREIAGVKVDMKADLALIVTTSSYTKPAREFARRNRVGSMGIRLIDYKTLMKLLHLST